MSAAAMPTTVPDSLLGLTIDHRYEILTKIGEGGIGAVFLARDRKMMNRAVVVKVLLEGWLDNPEIRRKFEHEKEALSRIDHPGVVGILDAGTIPENKPYLVMPFAPGLTLEEILRQNPTPSFEFCASVIEAVAETLSVVHAKGILHRDVKPENIIVEEAPGKKPRVRLIDFGIARVLDSQISPVTQVERTIGTVWYVAPEQLLGSIEQTPAIDIFSLGVIGYFMLTGQRPFDPQTIAEMAVMHKEGPRRLPSQINDGLSTEIDRIISRALLYEPEARTSSAIEFGEALGRALRKLDQAQAAPITKGHMRAMPTLPAAEDRPVVVIDRSKTEGAKTWLPSAENLSKLNLPSLRPWFTFGLIVLSSLIVLGIVTGSVFWWRKSAIVLTNDRQPESSPVVPTAVATDNPALRISLEVQTMQDPDFRPESADTINRTPFVNGDKVRITVTPTRKGNLYLFSEDDLGSERYVFDLLFPSGRQQQGFPQVEAETAVTTAPFEFTRQPGSEVIWFVWTAEPIKALDEGRINAIKNDGTVSDKGRAEELKAFFQQYNLENFGHDVNPDGVVLASGMEKLILFRMSLEHR